jgi:hypothetical protein
MEPTRKITVALPRELLRKAQKATGAGITATIRRGLELVAAGRAPGTSPPLHRRPQLRGNP